MSDLPVLTILIALPLVGALVTAFLPGATARLVGVGVSGVALVWAVLAALTSYTVDGGMQLTETHTWIEALGVHYALGVDGLGLVMVLLTTLLVPIVLVASWHEADAPGNGGSRAFVAWVLALEAMSLAVFTATDVFLFYVVFEATLIPAYFLIGGFGREGRGGAAVKFLIYQLAGGLVMLASVIGFYVVSADAGRPSFLISDLAALDIDPVTQRWLFLGFFIAFAIKAPLFPVHTWLADTTEHATTGTSVLLVCVLDKIGTFGMLRFCLGLLPDASQWATPAVVVLALISIVYGALVAIGQDDVLRLIGLTSLSHFGFIVLGIFVLNTQGGSGAVLYMVNHGVATAALFLVAGYLVQRRGTASIRAMGGGIEKGAPVLAGIFLISGLAACGLPGLSTFVSEMLVLIAAFQHAWWAGAVAVTAIVLAAIYVLWLYQRTMTGPEQVDVRDLDRREVGTLAPLVLALVLFGFVPMPLLDAINPYVEDTLAEVGVTDEAPTVPAADDTGDHATDEAADGAASSQGGHE
ncbi:NADH-quinone oxidoreductase subunit M [Nocardioides sp. Soil805]|uniref:NADH-quinone oxidoreductase subunit M n=1 Tax=Nocardioides sp. Soil805 TaxID=1736416 RepID=UPI0007032970|nr:NADH-quinone oxidoreductase subunit M [Nocardioides sp. Soil805]KRF37118.1 NADH:ubiquinone oxidoreductase subunit M [Nocardioides sp. Soil805]